MASPTVSDRQSHKFTPQVASTATTLRLITCFAVELPGLTFNAKTYIQLYVQPTASLACVSLLHQQQFQRVTYKRVVRQQASKPLKLTQIFVFRPVC
jgi:hypothetical protein